MVLDTRIASYNRLLLGKYYGMMGERGRGGVTVLGALAWIGKGGGGNN